MASLAEMKLCVQRLPQRVWVALAAAVLPLVAWCITGPVLLERRVEIAVRADKDHAGLVGAWSLEWARADGTTIDGMWLDVPKIEPPQPGPATVGPPKVLSPRAEPYSLPGYRFDRVVLRWRGAGMGLYDPGEVTLVDSIGGNRVRTMLRRVSQGGEGSTFRDGLYYADGESATMAWRMPLLTVMQVADVGIMYLALWGAGLAVWVITRRLAGQGFSPIRAAMAVVVAVHLWMAWKAPMLYCPDSMDYVYNANVFSRTHTFAHFLSWRLPGYSMFLWPFLAIEHFNATLGWVQAVMGLVTVWLAGRIVRTYLGPAWAALVILLVGIDPQLLNFERHAMPECLCTLMATLGVWTVTRGRFWGRSADIGRVLAALGLGLLLAGACYVRGNMMVLLGLLPLVMGVTAWLSGHRKSAVVLTLAAWMAGGAFLAPWVLKTKRGYGVYAFVVGSGYTRALSLAEDREMDLNQTNAFTAEEWEKIRVARQNKQMAAHGVLQELRDHVEGPMKDATAGLQPWTQQDARGRLLVAEALARHPTHRARHVGKMWLNQMGLWQVDGGVWQETSYWRLDLTQWVKGINYRVRPEDFRHLVQADVKQLYDRTVDSTAPWNTSAHQDAFRYICQLGDALRPVLGAASILAVLCVAARRRWELVMLGVVFLAHSWALAAMLLTGIDRYQTPLYPLMWGMACFAFAVLAKGFPRAVWTSDGPMADEASVAPRR